MPSSGSTQSSVMGSSNPICCSPRQGNNERQTRLITRCRQGGKGRAWTPTTAMRFPGFVNLPDPCISPGSGGSPYSSARTAVHPMNDCSSHHVPDGRVELLLNDHDREVQRLRQSYVSSAAKPSNATTPNDPLEAFDITLPGQQRERRPRTEPEVSIDKIA